MFSKLLMKIGLLSVSAVFVSGCYMYQDRQKVLLSGIDIDETLIVAQAELDENKFSTVLTVWAMRDQVINKEQARHINHLYFQYIDSIDSPKQKAREFSVWHLTWAIANMYRLGDDHVKQALILSYVDSAKRVAQLDMKIAHTMYNGEKMFLGDAHFGGRAYAKGHLVVPGNKKYLQSADEYFGVEN